MEGLAGFVNAFITVTNIGTTIMSVLNKVLAFLPNIASGLKTAVEWIMGLFNK